MNGDSFYANILQPPSHFFYVLELSSQPNLVLIVTGSEVDLTTAQSI
jgi:hypothetical protein